MVKARSVTVFAPSNIALIKYWGKRDQKLNLPVTASLSVTLQNEGTTTTLSCNDEEEDQVFLDNQRLAPQHPFRQRLLAFINTLRPDTKTFYTIKTTSNLPIAAGLASSASGFAALIKAFAALYNWQLPPDKLSVLARLGSGSACRSLNEGFVLWHRGEREDGLDSFAEPIAPLFPEFSLGLLLVSAKAKALSSREAMNQTTATSPLYDSWPKTVRQDLAAMLPAIEAHDVHTIGHIAERNSLAMHATMLAASPAICYLLPETLALMQTIWQLRREGLDVHFTQDAGPNLKLIFARQDLPKLKQAFPNLTVLI